MTTKRKKAKRSWVKPTDETLWAALYAAAYVDDFARLGSGHALEFRLSRTSAETACCIADAGLAAFKSWCKNGYYKPGVVDPREDAE